MACLRRGTDNMPGYNHRLSIYTYVQGQWASACISRKWRTGKKIWSMPGRGIDKQPSRRVGDEGLIQCTSLLGTTDGAMLLGKVDSTWAMSIELTGRTRKMKRKEAQ